MARHVHLLSCTYYVLLLYHFSLILLYFFLSPRSLLFRHSRYSRILSTNIWIIHLIDMLEPWCLLMFSLLRLPTKMTWYTKWERETDDRGINVNTSNQASVVNILYGNKFSFIFHSTHLHYKLKRMGNCWGKGKKIERRTEDKRWFISLFLCRYYFITITDRLRANKGATSQICIRYK